MTPAGEETVGEVEHVQADPGRRMAVARLEFEGDQDPIRSRLAGSIEPVLQSDLTQWSLTPDRRVGAMSASLARCAQPPAFSFKIATTAALKILCASLQTPSKLVAVVAPVGYGKTVLLSTVCQGAQQWAGACWWFSLDERDTSVDRLLSYLEGRLGDAAHGAGGSAEPLSICPGASSLDEPIDRIVTAIGSLRLPTVLFIVNVNYCQDPALARLLSHLVFATPPNIKLVLSSTELLPIDMVRCKLEGQVTELGTAELSFDADGVRELFGTELCGKLSSAAIGKIVRYTEGWPAAVRLTQILLSSASDPELSLANFIGTGQDIATILATKVLSGFSQELREFLLRLSLLRDFDTHLARVATHDPQAQAHLAYLGKRNVFLVQVDGARRNRLHNVFRDYLRGEASNTLTPDCRNQVYRSAAEWSLKNGREGDAVDYALLGGHVELAIEVLEHAAPTFVRDQGNHGRYLAWVEQLHAAGQYGGLETDYWYVWALAFRRRYEDARREVERLAQRVASAAQGSSSDALKLGAVMRRVEVIRIAIACYMDRLPEVKLHASRWLAPSAESSALVDAPFDLATVACAASYHDANVCDLASARAMVRLASVNIAQAGSHYGKGWVAAVEALVRLREGAYADVYASLIDALDEARSNLGDNAGICSTLSLLAAKAAVEMDLHDQAHALLVRGLWRSSTHGLLDTTAHGLDAAVKLWNGVDTEEISLARLRKVAASYPPRLSLMLSCFIARRCLQLGRVEEAGAEAAVLGISPHIDDALRERFQHEHGAALADLVHATQLELTIAAGKLKLAAGAIATELIRARACGRSARQIELALDEAFLSQCTGQAAPAARYLTRAIALAARSRYLRPFRDRREFIATLVNDTRPKDWPFVTEDERRFFAEICSGLQVAGGAILEQITDSDGHRTLDEAPTSREFELLGLIDVGLSNQDIADRLSLSVATVKWHLYNLYTKLGVKNRAAALARARSLHLLSR